MSESLDSLAAKALIAAGANQEAMVAASRVLLATKWGDEAYHEAHAVLHKAVEAGLRAWVRNNPPGQADYTADAPMRGVWLYVDTLKGISGIAIHEINGMVTQNSFPKAVKQVLQSRKGAAKNREKDLVTARHPEYSALLKEIVEAKRSWKEDDKRIKGTHEFRMMGGIARMGTSASVRYRDLIKQAQRMEQSALGKTLTNYTKV